MPPRSDQGPIVGTSDARGQASADRAAVLWQRLQPHHWPLPIEAWPAGTALVGGAVRDGLLDRLGEKPDLDLVVPGNGIELAKAWARRHGGTCVVLDAERQIARLVIQGWSLDVARQEGENLEADLLRRDFTINAIALPLPQGGNLSAELPGAARLVDPTGGLVHLEQHQVVAVREANLCDDPLRLLRGLRLASTLDFELDPRSRSWIHRHAPLLATVAGERVLAELEKLAATPLGNRGLQDCLQLGLLQPWGADPTALQALEELDAARASSLGLTPEEQAWALPLARLACLFDSPALKTLRSSRQLQQRCQNLRQWQGAVLTPPSQTATPPETATNENQLLKLHQALEADLPALALRLPVMDAQAGLRRWRDPSDPLFHPRAPIDGQTLQHQLGIAPGPQLGALLHHLTLEHAFGRLPQGSEPMGLAAVLDAANRWLEGGDGAQPREPSKSRCPRRD